MLWKRALSYTFRSMCKKWSNTTVPQFALSAQNMYINVFLNYIGNRGIFRYFNKSMLFTFFGNISFLCTLDSALLTITTWIYWVLKKVYWQYSTPTLGLNKCKYLTDQQRIWHVELLLFSYRWLCSEKNAIIPLMFILLKCPFSHLCLLPEAQLFQTWAM